MHLNALTMRILQHGDIAGDDSCYTCLFGVIHDCSHQRQVLGIHNGIECEVRLHARFVTDSCNLMQVGCGEVSRRASTHIQVLNAEIDAIRACFDGGSETLPATDRGHNIDLRVRRKALLLDDIFRYLHGIERSTFAYLIADTPESESVLLTYVCAYAPDIDLVSTTQEERHRIFLVGGIV